MYADDQQFFARRSVKEPIRLRQITNCTQSRSAVAIHCLLTVRTYIGFVCVGDENWLFNCRPDTPPLLRSRCIWLRQKRANPRRPPPSTGHSDNCVLSAPRVRRSILEDIAHHPVGERT
jgi:hypothetical protein